MITQPVDPVTLVSAQDGYVRAIQASRAVFEESPVVVLAPSGDQRAQVLAAGLSVERGVPLLLVPETGVSSEIPAPLFTSANPSNLPSEEATTSPLERVIAEVKRLHAGVVIAVGEVGRFEIEGIRVVNAGDTAEAVFNATGISVLPSTTAGVSGIAEMTCPNAGQMAAGTSDITWPKTAPSLLGLVAVSTDAADDVAAAATARAVGASVKVMSAGVSDVLEAPAVIDAFHDAQPTATLLLGAALASMGDPEWVVRAAETGYQLRGGGQRLFDDHLFVAIYGAPDAPVLGVLGEQDVSGTIARAQRIAATYDALTSLTVIPTLEIIATVAAGDPGADGNYSNELSVEELLPYVDAAASADMPVILDLQPGRTDFLTQAKIYQELLERPNVSLALDPEWRLGPDEIPLEQIGTVDAEEINDVTKWLADLVHDRGLPPKMMVLHQFQTSMIAGRADIITDRPEVEVLIHVDGQGGQPDKQATWEALHADAPTHIGWGWKNFYDEDTPILTPQQTMSEVTPTPNLITYQ